MSYQLPTALQPKYDKGDRIWFLYIGRPTVRFVDGIVIRDCAEQSVSYGILLTPDGDLFFIDEKKAYPTEIDAINAKPTL